MAGETPLNNLVIMKDRQAVTDSLKVADAFNKNHRDVMRAISTKINSAQNCAQFKRMFAEATYQDASGKSNRMYYMNRDGFTFIAMGFTGRKADDFKLKYIQAFNKMEQPEPKNFHTANELGKIFGTNGWGVEQMAQKLKLQAPVPESNRFGKWIQNGDFPEWLYTDAAIKQIEQYGFLVK